jgi:hypothetical protein
LQLKQACEEQDQRPIEFKGRVVAEVFMLIRKEKQIPRFARNDNLWLWLRVESSCRVLSKFCGQATKGAWWMPWQKQAMKDVASCDKPRGAASRL